MQFVKPTPYREAIDKLGSRSPIGSKLSSSGWADVPVALRERAQFSSRVESVRFLQRVQDGILDFISGNTETLPNGMTAFRTGGRAQFIEQMRQMAMREGLGPLDGVKPGSLQDITSERRLGLIFDVQTRQAQDFGYRKQGMDPDVLNEWPAQRFIRERDVREPRTSHTLFEDQVFLKTDPIWSLINQDFGVPWGPWGWGCGHDVEDVDRTEAESLGLLKPGERLEPPAEDFNAGLEASTKGLDPELITKLKNDLGDRVEINGETIRWNPEAIGREIALSEPLRQHPISDALDLEVYGKHKEAVILAMGAIEKVQDTSMLPKIPVRDTNQSAYGFVKPKLVTAGIGTDFMAVRSSGPWPALTAVHETGHFLDIEAIGAKGTLATHTPLPEMQRVLAAANDSEAVQHLRAIGAAAASVKTQEHYSYLTSPHEIWARAYAQYIAEKSGYRQLLKEVQMVRTNEKWRQWSAEDFAPIATEIDAMFRKLGWL